GRGGWCRPPVGTVEDEVGVVGGRDEDQPTAGAGGGDGSGQTRSSLPRLWARQASRYSPAARARPRRLRVVKPRASLSWPKTGSTMALRGGGGGRGGGRRGGGSAAASLRELEAHRAGGPTVLGLKHPVLFAGLEAVGAQRADRAVH